MLSMFQLLFGYFKKSFHSIFFGFLFPIIDFKKAYEELIAQKSCKIIVKED